MPKRQTILKRIRDGVLYFLARFLLFLGRYIPDSLGYALGESLGSFAFHCAGREREKAKKNLKIAFGAKLSESRVNEITKGMFVHFGRVLFEVLRIPRMTRRRISELFTFEGLETVLSAIKSGRGVVVATGHIGNWELLGAAVAKLGVPINVIARRLYDSRLNELVVRLRERGGVRTIERESSASAREILRCLRRGEMLALLIDQDIRVEGAFVPFFGKPAYTPVGAAALALRTDSLFIAAAAQRLGPGRHLVRSREIKISAGSERETAIAVATAEATEQLEAWIREMPEQWSWNHNRWRTTQE